MPNVLYPRSLPELEPKEELLVAIVPFHLVSTRAESANALAVEAGRIQQAQGEQ